MKDLDDDRAVSLARKVISIGAKQDSPPTYQLARAVIRLSAQIESLTIPEDDRRAMLTIAADRTAAERWPDAIEALGRALEKYGDQ